MVLNGIEESFQNIYSGLILNNWIVLIATDISEYSVVIHD